ncbi:hypothetical protein [Azospirillum soli]|nr:hypothetical protein [Azospirillum soli]MBP2312212.1 hypothetical protein [Azospirillum soli]
MAMGRTGPRKLGVYEGAGTVRAQSRTVLMVVAAIFAGAVLLVLLH